MTWKMIASFDPAIRLIPNLHIELMSCCMVRNGLVSWRHAYVVPEVIASPDGEVPWVPGALPGRAIAILAVSGALPSGP